MSRRADDAEAAGSRPRSGFSEEQLALIEELADEIDTPTDAVAAAGEPVRPAESLSPK
jgi:hypothetical protein